MRLKEKNLLQKFAATLKKYSAQGAKKVEYGNYPFKEILSLLGALSLLSNPNEFQTLLLKLSLPKYNHFSAVV